MGATAEEIVAAYDSLALADVYLVIGFFIRNREAVDAYMALSQRRNQEAREENERRFPREELRDRLTARGRPPD